MTRYNSLMPIKIYPKGNPDAEVAWLCDDQWELPVLIEALSAWVSAKPDGVLAGSYIADVGFSPRPGAAGGGCVLTGETLIALGQIGVDLWFSEYPPMVDEG